MKETVKTGTKIGAFIGVIIFLFFGLLPGFHFGGYGAIILLQKLSGGAVESTLLTRITVVCGMFIGIFSMATISLVMGSILGTLAGYLVSSKESKKILN